VSGPDDDRVHLAVHGPAWTAQAGSGDVLAGICGTLLAAGLEPVTAAVCAASIQAMTAAAHPGPYPPQDLARMLPGTVAGLRP
jgi:NAD(P)H-hydrate repair Nnr-like enzyme with NAD(P)H-hydrate dehydratase domain